MPIFGEGASSGFAPSAFLTFLGRGIDTPFRRGANDFASSEGIDHIRSLVANVIGTRSQADIGGESQISGELPWRTDFGSLLHLLRHKNNTVLVAELARVHVADALARWVPQVRFREVETSIGNDLNGEPTVLHMRVRYDVIGINRPGNEVLVPDVTQVVTV